MIRFDGRVAVVTGAGSGLGRAHAHLLAARGATVMVNDLTPAAAQTVADEIVNAGGLASPFAADVASPAGADALVAAAVEAHGRLDIVVNNAGMLRAADIGEMSNDLFDQMLAVNLGSVFRVVWAAWPHLAAQGYGRIVSTTSNSGLLGTAGSTGYAAAKAGIWGLTLSLALEGCPLGIHVNAIGPMAFTPMSQQSRVAPESWRSGEGDAWGRRLHVNQVSPAVAWLAHESCDVTGQIWSSAGGRVARFALGLTHGFDSDALTIEQVRDKEHAIVDISAPLDYFVNSGDEGRALHRRLMPPAPRDGSASVAGGSVAGMVEPVERW